MIKKIIHLFPYKFIDHDYQIREYAELEKKFKTEVIIHDLSKIFYPNLDYIEAKSFKKSIKFNSLADWLKTLDSLKKQNVSIVSELSCDSIKSLIIHYYLKKSKLPVSFDTIAGVIDEADFFSNNLSFEKIIIKFIRVIKNPILLFHYIKKKILRILFQLIKFDKIFIFLCGGQIKDFPFRAQERNIIQCHSRDYSNSLILEEKKLIRKEKPIIFLDSPSPYFMDDEIFIYNQKRVKDIPRWYEEHNIFFDKLESMFSTKVIIVPHPKTKGVENPYFKKRLVDHSTDAALKLTPSSLFVISNIFVSTAISFAIASLKPIFLIYSDQMKNHYKKQFIVERGTAKFIGCGLIDINNFIKKDILNNMKVNSELYDNYKNKFLTSKKLSNKPNHMIIGNLLLNS